MVHLYTYGNIMGYLQDIGYPLVYHMNSLVYPEFGIGHKIEMDILEFDCDLHSLSVFELLESNPST